MALDINEFIAKNAAYTKAALPGVVTQQPDEQQEPSAPLVPQTEEEFAKETIDYASMDESASDPFTEEGAAAADRIITAKAKRDPIPFVPAELKAKPNWVRWQLEPDKNGKPTKVPYQLNGNKASHSNPATWGTYEAVITGAALSENEGVGICCDGTFAGFDLDGCRNPVTGEVKEWAKRIIETLGTYTEITPSGYGVRVLALGTLPDGARRFSLALSAGFGDKVGIETYHQTRYFTVTGNRIGDTRTMVSTNVVQAHALCADISREFPSEKRVEATQFHGDDSGNSSVAFTKKPGSLASKLSVLMYGKVVSNKPFVVENEHGDQVTAPSQSEADMSLATLLAIKHGDNPELIDQDFRESSLYRPKWDRLADSQIAKAIASAKKAAEKTPAETYTAPAQPSDAQPNAAQTQAHAAEEASRGAEGTFPTGEAVGAIPEFDDSVITGVYRKIVDAACNGTTIPRQFAFLAAKVYIGAMLAGKVTFEGMEDTSSYYGVVIGLTGTSKGLSWKRTVDDILAKGSTITPSVKILEGSGDSGAGLKDFFFDEPRNAPVICMIDEATSLGHKAGEKKNPEIVDTIIELATKHKFTRVKAARSKKSKAGREHDNAHLSLYMCAQDKEVIAGAFPNRRNLGLFERFEPEYSPPIEAGRLPKVDQKLAVEIWNEVQRLPQAGEIKMATGVEDKIESHWDGLPKEVRTRVRLKTHLKRDMFIAAHGRGSMIAEMEDLDVALKIFPRQLRIRAEFLTTEVPDKVGLYLSRLKAITADMRRRLNKGEPIWQVATSVRDLQTDTHAFRDNELHFFNQAWRAWENHVRKVKVLKKNGQEYEKFIPEPYDDEVWNEDGKA